jgi:hypothetical protein
MLPPKQGFLLSFPPLTKVFPVGYGKSLTAIELVGYQ